MTEHRAAWAAAWRALGRPELGRDEAEMSEGQLRVRVRAWEREQAWAPEYVGDELRMTAQAAARHRQDAVMAAARAASEASEERRRELQDEAQQRGALADVLAEAERQLDVADAGRAAWYAHTAPTRQAAERAGLELRSRGVDPAAGEQRVTAAEWLAAERAARVEDDQHRPVAEQDVVDGRPAAESSPERPVAAEPEPADADREPVDEPSPGRPVVDESSPDRRDVDEREPAAVEEAEPAPPADRDDDAPALPRGVPSAAEAKAAALKAHEALDRIDQREAEEQAYQAEADEEQHARQVAWQHQDAVRAEEVDADVR